MTQWLIWLVRQYQRWLSPRLPRLCRFHPTCSEYAIQAFSLHGVWRGGWLTLRRLVRCQPFCAGGYDPVPGTESRDSGAEAGGNPCAYQESFAEVSHKTS